MELCFCEFPTKRLNVKIVPLLYPKVAKILKDCIEKVVIQIFGS